MRENISLRAHQALLDEIFFPKTRCMCQSFAKYEDDGWPHVEKFVREEFLGRSGVDSPALASPSGVSIRRVNDDRQAGKLLEGHAGKGRQPIPTFPLERTSPCLGIRGGFTHDHKFFKLSFSSRMFPQTHFTPLSQSATTMARAKADQAWDFIPYKGPGSFFVPMAAFLLDPKRSIIAWRMSQSPARRFPQRWSRTWGWDMSLTSCSIIRRHCSKRPIHVHVSKMALPTGRP